MTSGYIAWVVCVPCSPVSACLFVQWHFAGLLDDEDTVGSYANVGDISTTNIYVGNLDPQVHIPIAQLSCRWLIVADAHSSAKTMCFVAMRN